MEIEFQGGDDLQTNYPQAPVQGSFQCAFDPQEIPKLEINASYNSADELMAAVRHFQRTTGAKFYIRDCVTLGELGCDCLPSSLMSLSSYIALSNSNCELNSHVKLLYSCRESDLARHEKSAVRESISQVLQDRVQLPAGRTRIQNEGTKVASDFLLCARVLHYTSHVSKASYFPYINGHMVG